MESMGLKTFKARKTIPKSAFKMTPFAYFYSKAKVNVPCGPYSCPGTQPCCNNGGQLWCCPFPNVRLSYFKFIFL